MSAYRKILVAVDGSHAAGKGLREAIRLAKAEGARLFIVHVVDDLPAFASLEGMAPGVDLVPMLREGGERILAKAEAVALKQKIKPRIILRERFGGPAE